MRRRQRSRFRRSQSSLRSAYMIDLGWPIIFWQKRIGYRGRPFLVFKFRTLHAPYNRLGDFVEEDRRTSRFGSFLRRTAARRVTSAVEYCSWRHVLRGPSSIAADRSAERKSIALADEARSNGLGADQRRQANYGGRKGQRWTSGMSAMRLFGSTYASSCAPLGLCFLATSGMSHTSRNQWKLTNSMAKTGCPRWLRLGAREAHRGKARNRG